MPPVLPNDSTPDGLLRSREARGLMWSMSARITFYLAVEMRCAWNAVCLPGRSRDSTGAVRS